MKPPLSSTKTLSSLDGKMDIHTTDNILSIPLNSSQTNDDYSVDHLYLSSHYATPPNKKHHTAHEKSIIISQPSHIIHAHDIQNVTSNSAYLRNLSPWRIKEERVYGVHYLFLDLLDERHPGGRGRGEGSGVSRKTPSNNHSP